MRFNVDDKVVIKKDLVYKKKYHGTYTNMEMMKLAGGVAHITDVYYDYLKGSHKYKLDILQHLLFDGDQLELAQREYVTDYDSIHICLPQAEFAAIIGMVV